MKGPDYSKSINACCSKNMAKTQRLSRVTCSKGKSGAYSLGNRGPIRFDEEGALHKEISDAYSKYGFYVFENVIDEQEMADIRDDMEALRERFPVRPDAKHDQHGRPAIGVDCKGPGLRWSKPLSDPLGGTQASNGRHQVKLKELQPDSEAPDSAPFILVGSLQFSEAALRTYAHPQILKVAEAVNGEDFAPFNEVLFYQRCRPGCRGVLASGR